jgi:hypothetical protein
VVGLHRQERQTGLGASEKIKKVARAVPAAIHAQDARAT